MQSSILDISKLSHLLDVLRARSFTQVEAEVPMRWTAAAPERRATVLSGSTDAWPAMTKETIWGAPQSYFWFAGRVTIPPALEGQRVYLWIEAQFGRVMGRSDPQCLVRVNGKIRQGADFNHREVLLSTCAQSGSHFDILIEAGTIEDRRQIGFGCQLMVHDALAEATYFDLKTPLDVAVHLPENDHRRDMIVSTVHAALKVIDLRQGQPARFHASLTAARAIAARIYAAQDTDATPTITVLGHTHIDVAWLWRVRETRQKMARSMATALTLMDEYPDYLFMYNQGYLLDALAQDYPDVFDGIQTLQKAGRFEIEGALWLEPDANMTSGESLVRHILRGLRYHQETFGVTPKIVWLPDTFGYSAALPQIMALAGLEVFVTHKMSWNDTNRMPNETFFWQGLDGTRVPTYFLTTQPMESTTIGTTYCPDLKASHVMGTWRRYAQKTTQDDLLLVYGHGDGGGGPTREMLEHIRRMERGIPGCPTVTHGHMGPFFDRLVAKMHDAPEDYPTWVGELYLEFHRGTFTSVAEVKRNNRQAEAMLRALEISASLAMVRAGYPYPQSQLAELWDIVLLNQFHDILPGSAIAEVYEDSRADFARFFAEAAELQSKLADALGGTFVLNPLGSAFSGLVMLPDDKPMTVGRHVSQSITRADGTLAQTIPLAHIPAAGGMRIELAAAADPATGKGDLRVTEQGIENAHLAVVLDSAGRIVSLQDKATGREVLTGPANRLQAFRDMPAQFDAWDIDATYVDQVWEVDDLQSIRVVETGPYRAAVRLEWRYESSTIVQVLSLAVDARQIEVDTYIDWKEPNTLLKSAFPLAIRADAVTAEVQFGHVTRPTHANTSWDQARFEAPMHRWVALQEPGFGAALLNDCKYGYDAHDQTLRLTLLRAPTWPWDGADIGAHHLRYGLAVFDDFNLLPPLAERFNHPLSVLQSDQPGTADLSPLLSVSDSAIVIETIKKAEDGTALIVRLWEQLGARCKAHVTFGPAITEAMLCDLLEVKQDALVILDSAVSLTFAPFEIKTLCLNWTAQS